MDDSERAAKLRAAGVPEHLITQVEPERIFEELAEQSVEDVPVTPAPVLVVDESTDVWAQAFAQAIQKRDRDSALAWCDEFGKARFDAQKLSKQQAFAQGMDLAGKSQHNRDLWNDVQTRVGRLKTEVRKHFKEQPGYVREAIRNSRTRDVKRFISDNESDPVVRAFMDLLQQSQEGGE